MTEHCGYWSYVCRDIISAVAGGSSALGAEGVGECVNKPPLPVNVSYMSREVNIIFAPGVGKPNYDSVYVYVYSECIPFLSSKDK